MTEGTAPTGDLRTKMASLAREIQRERGNVDDTLNAITRLAVDTVPGAAHAGITLVLARRQVESRAATSAIPRKLDELQNDLQQGPCLQSVYLHETVSAPDLANDDRWPRFSAAAVDLGIRAMMSFQLYTDSDNVGALNLYGTSRGVFDQASVDAGTALATHAAIALVAAQETEQLHSALASRDIIGQAKGMIMERYHVSAVRAFYLLSRLSQDSNVRVVDIARQIVESENLQP